MSNRRRGRRLSHHPISVLEFNQQYRGRVMDGEIEEEFQVLQEYCAELSGRKEREVARREENKPRNRFVDIVPCEKHKAATFSSSSSSVAVGSRALPASGVIKKTLLPTRGD